MATGYCRVVRHSTVQYSRTMAGKGRAHSTHAVIQSMQLLLAIQDIKGSVLRVPWMPGRMKPRGCAVDTVPLFMGGSVPSQSFQPISILMMSEIKVQNE